MICTKPFSKVTFAEANCELRNHVNVSIFEKKRQTCHMTFQIDFRYTLRIN
jgi:hypothetical protein